jgi:hypothetical protein
MKKKTARAFLVPTLLVAVVFAWMVGWPAAAASRAEDGAFGDPPYGLSPDELRMFVEGQGGVEHE